MLAHSPFSQASNACRPTILLEEEFAGIPAATAVLHRWFDVDAVDHMVQEQPLFLVEDVEDAISSLNRSGILPLAGQAYCVG